MYAYTNSNSLLEIKHHTLLITIIKHIPYYMACLFQTCPRCTANSKQTQFYLRKPLGKWKRFMNKAQFLQRSVHSSLFRNRHKKYLMRYSFEINFFILFYRPSISCFSIHISFSEFNSTSTYVLRIRVH